MNNTHVLTGGCILLGLELTIAPLLGATDPAKDPAMERPAGAAPAGREATSAEAAYTKPENMFVSAEDISQTRIEAQRDKFLKERGWELGMSKKNPNGAYVGWGSAPITARSTDLKFGQSRVLAYEKAAMIARGEFVSSRMQTVSTETIREFFRDDRPLPAPDQSTPQSRMRILGEKVLALTEAELDQKLRQADVDPETISETNLEKKRALMSDRIMRREKRQAIRAVAGVRVLATFEDLQHIGVLIVYSDHMNQLAKSITLGQMPSRPNKKDPKDSILRQLEAICPDGSKDFIDIYGVRLMTDDNGDAAVVAFGQWSPAIVKTDSKLRQNSELQAARIIARNTADGALTEFVNSTVVLDSDTLREEVAEISRIDTYKGALREEEKEQIGQAVRETIKQNGKITLAGVTAIKEWTGNHPETGHLIVGQILLWTPSTRDSALGKSTTSGHGLANDARGTVRVSPDFDKDADF